jgi:hypothetical protein
MCPVAGACSRALALGGTLRQTVRPRLCAAAVESDEGADLAWRDTIGPRAELASFRTDLDSACRSSAYPNPAARRLGTRGVKRSRSPARARQVAASAGGGKRSDEARPSLRAACRSKPASARRRAGARVGCVPRRPVVWPRRVDSVSFWNVMVGLPIVAVAPIRAVQAYPVANPSGYVRH